VTEPSQGDPRHPWRGTLISIVILVVMGIAIGFLVDQPTGFLKGLPKSLQTIVHAVIVLAVGFGVSRLLERRLFRLASDHLRADQTTWLKYLVRLVLYVTIILSILAAVGVGLSSLVFGGAFATVIIGLAGQQVFANIIGGAWLLIFHPFRVGDYIGLVTWQYPLLMPSYPHEALRPAYYGHVRDINFMYTELENNDGYPQLIPNGIIMQAFIENRSGRPNRHLRVRLDIPLDVDAALFADEFSKVLEPHCARYGEHSISIKMADVSVGGYSFLVTFDVNRNWEDARSDVLLQAAIVLRQMRQQS